MAQMNYLLTKVYEARAQLGRRIVSACGFQGLAGWRGEYPAQIVEYSGYAKREPRQAPYSLQAAQSPPVSCPFRATSRRLIQPCSRALRVASLRDFTPIFG